MLFPVFKSESSRPSQRRHEALPIGENEMKHLRELENPVLNRKRIQALRICLSKVLVSSKYQK